MKPTLQLRLSQHLALTPQLQQSIRLLQLSTLELNQEIEQAVADNPLLERDDDPLADSRRLRADGSIEPSAPAEGASTEAEADMAARADADSPPADDDAAPATMLEWGRGETRTDDEESRADDWRDAIREVLHMPRDCDGTFSALRRR